MTRRTKRPVSKVAAPAEWPEPYPALDLKISAEDLLAEVERTDRPVPEVHRVLVGLRLLNALDRADTVEQLREVLRRTVKEVFK